MERVESRLPSSILGIARLRSIFALFDIRRPRAVGRNSEVKGFNMSYEKVVVIGGGTISHVRNHLALAAVAYGGTAIQIADLVGRHPGHIYHTDLILTKMADPRYERSTKVDAKTSNPYETNQDITTLVDQLIADDQVRVVFFNVALCDFSGEIEDVSSGKYASRLKSREGERTLTLTMQDKLLGRFRKERKDIFLIGFKTTAGASEDEQYIAGLNLLKSNSVNMVLANDTVTRNNMIIVPEEARYAVTTDRKHALTTLVDMAMARSQLHFTRSTVIPGETVDWNGDEVPDSLREVVNHCIAKGAYKPFRGNTAGHFAYKVDDTTFITSKRKTNYNNLDKVGLVKVVSTGRDSVVAHGFKPSVGGQSQRIIFEQHPEADCIVHFHSPVTQNVNASLLIPRRLQQWLECGSHECGLNTSVGLREVEPGIKVVYLEEHGPNIVFNRNIDPNRVTSFIDRYFDLEAKTGGLLA